MQTARAVPAATVVNLRDLGGIALGRDLRVRQGVLLRSGQLSGLDAERDLAVAALGIRTVVDLRTADERQWAPDRLPPGARLFVADVLGGNSPGITPARLRTLLSDPDGAARTLGGGRVEELFAQTYRTLVLSPGAAAAYRALLETAADPGARPVLFHCTAGKDRTGVAVALLLSFLGVDDATVAEDYALSQQHYSMPLLTELEVRFAELDADLDRVRAFFEAQPAAMLGLLADLRARFGGAAAYLAGPAGVSPEDLARLRERLLDGPPAAGVGQESQA